MNDAADELGRATGDRPALRRYGVALLLTLGGLVAAVLLQQVAEEPIYGPLIGVVAIVVWYGGIGPAVLSIVVGFAFALGLFVEPYPFALGSGDDMARWGVNLAVALAIGWAAGALQQSRERASTVARTVQASVHEMAGIQALTTSLSAAVTPSDVAHALLEETPALVGARGGSLGLVDGDELEIVDPRGVAGQTHQPGLRLPLGVRAPIAEAARTGALVVVRDRETFEREFPEGAALTLYAHGALAVPLRVAGDVVGSVSLLYGEDATIREESETIAALAADLGGQALERARLFQREREARQALDRILRVAPRFHAESLEAATEAICREARTTFGADLVTLWRLREQKLVLVQSDPKPEPLEPGMVVEPEDFPELREAIASVEPSFVSDIQTEARGAGLERTRRLGLHSSLRTPIAIGGAEAEIVLIVSWARVVTEPDPPTLAIVRRFTDQAGLALEQVERRRAEEEAARRADETRRLQGITAALAIASTAADVSTTCLEHALEAVGAEAGFVVLTRPESVTIDLVTSSGYEEDEVAHWGGLALDADVPFARAISSGEAVWAFTADEVAAFTGATAGSDLGWAVLPLKTAAGVRGALHLAFRSPRELGEGERRWLQTIVSQCAQALERSRLFDAEQLLRRRSERLQGMTAALSAALTRADVAHIVVDEVGDAVGADGAALAEVVVERGRVTPLAMRGYSEDVPLSWLEVSPDVHTPASRALESRASAFYESLDELRTGFPDVADDLARLGHESFLFVPLIAGRRANTVFVVSWEQRYELAPEERRFVEALVGQAAQTLDRATSFETEQTIAETLQRSVLPASLPRVDGMQLSARYLPGTAGLDVGGDWFDAIVLADGRLGLVVGDVVGKGVQAASTMAQLRNALRAFSLDRMKPSSTMARLNRLAEEVVETTFATLVYATVDPVTRVCRFTSAGHPPPLVAYPDGRVELLEGGRGLPLGAGADTDVHAGRRRAAGRDGAAPVHRRARRATRPPDRRRACRAPAGGSRRPSRAGAARRAHPRAAGRERTSAKTTSRCSPLRVLAVAPQPLHVRIPSDVGALDVVRDALRVWLAGASLDRTDAEDVVLATWEACANAIEHAGDARERTRRRPRGGDG